MSKTVWLALILSAINFAGCDKSDCQLPKIVASGEAVATVNGQPISRSAMEVFVEDTSRHMKGQKLPEDKVVADLINRELMAQEIADAELLKDPKVAAKLENALRMALSQVSAESYMARVTVTDEEARKEYDEHFGPSKNSEYKARHILVETEPAAKDIIAKLRAGEPFEVLAKQFSKDSGTKDKGGDLGWFKPERMVEPFARAIADMKKGETTQEPVQSNFGWHVIVLDDVRQQTPPAFDNVKDRIKMGLKGKKLHQHMEDLRAKAKIENKVATKPAAPTPQPAAPTAPVAPPTPAAPASPAVSPPKP